MTTADKSRLRLVAWIAGVGALMVFMGYATFEQWAGLVRALLG